MQHLNPHLNLECASYLISTCGALYLTLVHNHLFLCVNCIRSHHGAQHLHAVQLLSVQCHNYFVDFTYIASIPSLYALQGKSKSSPNLLLMSTYPSWACCFKIGPTQHFNQIQPNKWSSWELNPRPWVCIASICTPSPTVLLWFIYL